MSGGSYNYLAYSEAEHIYEKIEQLEAMSNDLASLGYAADAARETEELLCILRHFHIRVQVRLNRLNGVWHAMEWWRSGDSGECDVTDALKKYRASVEYAGKKK